ncbi:TPM domain-containing protein [Xanthobacter sp. TB0139]|uniref:TPM domain-containing protein n=1 Tax=Xanthobacter sp. TB0139 TaxID=3459178 RepID=UPI00403997F6
MRRLSPAHSPNGYGALVPALIRQAGMAMMLLWLVLALPALAQTGPSYPELTGHVVDEAQILSPEIRTSLEAELVAQEEKTSDQLVVATVSSLDGLPIEDYANGLFRSWKLGQEKENNGLLLLVAPNERKVRIEVGYGLEGILTDAMASTIIRNVIIPEFKDGDMSEGTRKGAEAILELLNLDPEEAQARLRALEQQNEGMTDEDWTDLIIFIVFVVFCLFVIWRTGGGNGGQGGRRRRSNDDDGVFISTWDWGGSSGGGSSWGGGGGSSGGGGASGDW